VQTNTRTGIYLIAGSAEDHFIGECDRERMEEYLEAIWIILEQGRPLVRVSWIAKRLSLSMPSVVEMLKSLDARGYVSYTIGEGILLSPKGKAIARRIVRNHRLMELLMERSIGVPMDEKSACGFEHHMSDGMAQAICKKLGHPTECLHGQKIPTGKDCCNRSDKIQRNQKTR
jgi:DtxR family Mn-dependent transcriptional regulator